MTLKHGVFSSVKKAWLAIIAYTLFLYGTLSVAYDVFIFLGNWVGRDAVSGRMNMMFLLAGAVLLLFVIFRLPRTWSGSLSFALIGLAVAMTIYGLDIPAKRFHFFQYAPLTLLVFDALRFTLKDRWLYVGTLALVALIGVGDETIQWILPTRYFGFLDIIVNIEASLLTLVFIRFVLTDENYPWGSRRRHSSRDYA
ncbi:MAG: VanZ family protein [Candidatus Tectomicrobia bacterium]